MNGAHLHLLVNHVSLFALLIGALTLAVSMKRKSSELRVMSTLLFIITGIFAWIAVETGEGAEAVLKNLGDYKALIDTHEAAADWALASGITVAVVSLITEFAIWKKLKWVKPLQWILLILALHGCTVFAVTALHGGKIRHTEIRD